MECFECSIFYNSQSHLYQTAFLRIQTVKIYLGNNACSSDVISRLKNFVKRNDNLDDVNSLNFFFKYYNQIYLY